jgi:hypothetical protein
MCIMKTQSITQNTHLFLQSHHDQANTARDSFEMLHENLQRIVNLLSKRLYDLTRNQADLKQIGQAQRALAGALRDYHKTLAFLSDIQDIEPQYDYSSFPQETTVYHSPEPLPAQQPQPETQPQPTPEPIENTQPQPDSEPVENTQLQPDPTPPEPIFKPLDPGDPATEHQEETLPPLDPFADNFEEIATLYEQKLKTAIADLQKPPQPQPEPTPEPKTKPPEKIALPKKYNTRRKRKLQKRKRAA